MADNGDIRVLTINSGSSSLKFSLYRMGQTETRVLSGTLERIGLQGGQFRVRDPANGKASRCERRLTYDHIGGDGYAWHQGLLLKGNPRG